MITAPKPPHPSLEDLQAIDAMLTAARDHATAVCDASTPGSNLRSRADQMRQHLARACSENAWLLIDCGGSR